MKISVVLPSYNQGRFVEETLRSLIAQDYLDTEILFIDGGSTDETMAIVERYRDHIDVVVSEPDIGQSDALRKGFERATGNVLTWLNTDDLLLPGALKEVAETFERNNGCEWVLGNIIWFDAQGKILRCRKGDPYRSILPRIGVLSAYSPSAFFTKDLYERAGGINIDLHYKMDTELWWRFWLTGSRYYRTRRYLWAFRLHDEAKTSGAMFAKELTEKQKRQINSKRAEDRHIQELISNRIMRVPKPLAGVVQAINQATSPLYLMGLVQDAMWRGRQITDVRDGEL